MKKNIARVTGVMTELVFSHAINGEGFYSSYLLSSRKSAAVDRIPILISDRVFTIELLIPGIYLSVTGQFRSRNCNGKVSLYLFAENIQLEDVEENINEVSLEGYICRTPIFRTTPFGRDITGLLVAVNRSCGKSDYIPCICWGRNAKWAARMNVGDCVVLRGRIQSREYLKSLPDGTKETRIAYEVSISALEVVNDEERSEQGFNCNGDSGFK